MIGNHYLGVAQIQSLRPRVTFSACHIWRLERVDGVVQRYASHDKWVRFRGEDYRPVGPTASDMEQAEAGAESDFEIVGFLSADTVRASDIHAGRYEGARIVHYVIDWERPWPNAWHRKHVWWIKEINENSGQFQAKVQGVERFLSIPAGRVYERECDKTLGDFECKATARVLFGATIEAVGSSGSPILGLPHKNAAMRFTSGSWGWSPAIRDGLLMEGKVVWTNGPNKGTEQEIGDHVGREIILQLPTPFAIKPGDQCAVYSGCDGSIGTCTNDYANRINFGGQFRMPSTEDTYRKPSET